MAFNQFDYDFLEMVREQKMPPLIITVALTGGVHGKEVNPKLSKPMKRIRPEHL
jgi:hypothetical protein